MRKVPVFQTLALSTLADATVLTSNLTNASDNSYRLLTSKVTWAIDGIIAGEGPLTVGYAHNDYTVTEIKECLEAEANIDLGDKVAQERANRLVRRVGSFSGVANEVLNDGKPITTRLNWLIAETKTATLFVYNQSGAPLSTGARVVVNGSVILKFI